MKREFKVWVVLFGGDLCGHFREEKATALRFAKAYFGPKGTIRPATIIFQKPTQKKAKQK